jgi:segregation and condensation protein A
VGYAVNTPVFEGPFDVLLHLITKQQVELYEVSIAQIVDGFLAHLRDVQAHAEQSGEPLDLEMVTEFLLIAATLVELKTRRLLPGKEDADLDEELALWEERDLLLARLVECKTFKDAALALVDLENRAQRSYARRAGMEERFLSLTPDLLANTKPERLRAAYLRAMQPKPEPPKVSLSHVTQVKLTVHEAIDSLSIELPKVGRTTFRTLMRRYTEPMEVIVNFLGLLELFKQGAIDLEQGAGSLGELEVTWMGFQAGEDAIIDLRERALVDSYEG